MKRGPKPTPLPPHLIEKYVRGELSTIQDVADEAGVSNSVAWRKLRDAGVLQPQTRGRKPIPLSPLLIDKYAREELPTVQAVADEAGISYSTASQKLHEAGVLRHQKEAVTAHFKRLRQQRNLDHGRDAEIRKLRAAGWTLRRIAKKVGLSGERVRQILAETR